MPDNSTASHAVGTLPTVSDGQAQPVDANRARSPVARREEVAPRGQA